VLKKMMLLATVVAVVLAVAAMAAATAPASGRSANGYAKGDFNRNKDFAGLVDIGGGRKMYLKCRGKGSPTVILIPGFRGAYDDWTHVLGSGGEPKPSGSAVFP
jgi:opacity protein-like surface antigen